MSEHKKNPGTDALSHWLIRYAARRAPPGLSDRLAEEWQADSESRSSAMSRLRFALGCCWATTVIAREHHPASIPLVSTVLVSSATLSHMRNEPELFARRSIMLFLVAGLFIALFYGLMTGLAFRIARVMPTSFHAAALQAPTHAVPPLASPQLTLLSKGNRSM